MITSFKHANQVPYNTTEEKKSKIKTRGKILYKVAFLFSLVFTSCATPTLRVEKWEPKENAGVISAPLCDQCMTPHPWHIQRVYILARHKCGGGDFDIVKEGTSFSDNAGLTPEYRKTWAFKCRNP